MSSAGVIGRASGARGAYGVCRAVPRGSAALVLTGEAGVGKTTLWRAGIEAARERSFRARTASPTAAEASMSFAALGDLLAERVDDVLAALPPPQRRALEVALLLAEADGLVPSNMPSRSRS